MRRTARRSYSDCHTAAFLLPIVMEALPEFYVPQAPRLARALGLDSIGNRGELLLMDVIERIIALQRDIGCASDFSAYGISPEDGDKIAAAIAADPAAMFYPIPAAAITSIVARAIGHRTQTGV